jgi:hypothetical protein
MRWVVMGYTTPRKLWKPVTEDGNKQKINAYATVKDTVEPRKPAMLAAE